MLLEECLHDAESVAQRAVQVIASAAHDAVRARGRFLFATSGGTTPWRMLRLLADANFPWAAAHLFQVDERAVPFGDAQRNSTHLQESLLAHLPVALGGVYVVPPQADHDLLSAAATYAETLRRVAGSPPTLDLIHLGLGDDGHTASLVPNDAVLNVADRDVAETSLYMGTRRITMTYPTINRARQIVWVVTGASKRDALHRLRAGDETIPAGRVRRDHALLLCDEAASG